MLLINEKTFVHIQETQFVYMKKDILQSLFPLVFPDRLAQSNERAESFYLALLDHIRTLPNEPSILTSPPIFRPFPLSVQFHYEFSSAVILERSSPHVDYGVSLVFPSEWRTEIVIGKKLDEAAQYYHTDSASFNLLYIGQLSGSVAPKEFQILVKELIAKQKNKDTPRTPAWLRQTVFIAMNTKYSLPSFLQPQQKDKKVAASPPIPPIYMVNQLGYSQPSQKKSKTVVATPSLQSKGRTLFAAQYKSNTELEIGLAIVRKHLRDQNFFKGILLSYKLHWLNQLPALQLSKAQTRNLYIRCLRCFCAEVKLAYTKAQFALNQKVLMDKVNKLNLFYKVDSVGSPLKNLGALKESRFSIPLLKNQPKILPGSLPTHMLCRSLILQFYSDTPFRYLLNQKELQHHSWALKFQHMLFALARRTFTDKEVRNRLPLSELLHDTKYSSPILCVLYFYKQRVNSNLVGHGTNNLLKSHLQLVHQICAALAYQCLKQHRKDISLYRWKPPFKPNFKSYYFLDYEAKSALLALASYHRRQQKKKPFLNYQCVQQIVKKSVLKEACQKWTARKTAQLETAKQNMAKVIISCKARLKAAEEKYAEDSSSKCTCQQQNRGRHHFCHKIICLSCKKKQQSYKVVTAIKAETENKIIAPFPKNNPTVYSFLSCLDSALVGLMKLHQYQGIKYNSVRFNLYKADPQDYDTFIDYPLTITDITIYPLQFDLKFQHNVASTQQPDYEDNIREHKVYCESTSTKLQELGLLRVQNSTQIPLLTAKLLSGQLDIDCINDWNSQGWLTPFCTATDFSAYYDCSSLKLTPLYLSFQCMQHFLQHYHKIFSLKRLKELPLICVLHAIFSKECQQAAGLVALCQQLVVLLDNLIARKKEAESSKEMMQLMRRSAYLSFCGLICFVDGIVPHMQQQQSRMFAYFSLCFSSNYNFIKSGLGTDPMVGFLAAFQAFKLRAVRKSVVTVYEHLRFETYYLDQLAKKQYAGSSKVKWQVSKEGWFEGKGADGRTYKIDLQSGTFLLDSQCSNGLHQTIRNSQLYKSVFKERDLEVYLMKSGYYRTKQDFAQYMLLGDGSSKFKVFFEFGLQDKNAVYDCKQQSKEQETLSNFGYIFQKQKPPQKKFKILIRAVYQSRQTQDQLFYQALLNEDQRSGLSRSLPEHFMKTPHWWYLGQFNLVLLRPKLLEHMKGYEVAGLVQQNDVVRWLVPGESHSKLNFYEIKGRKRSEFLCLLDRPNNSQFKRNLPILLLSTIEHTSYIYQLQARDDEDKVLKYCFKLPRLKLNFELVDNVLYSADFTGYHVVPAQNSRLLPWVSEQGRNRCLLLQLSSPRENNLMAHKTKVIIPFLPVQDQGHMPIPEGQHVQVLYFVYQLHDHFQQLRGKSVLQNLHLCNFIVANGQGTVLPNRSTGYVEALRCLRACYSNMPLDKTKLQLVESIMQKSYNYSLHSLALCCIVLLRLSTCFWSLAFEGKEKDLLRKLAFERREQQADLLSSYLKSLERGRVPLQLQLNQVQLRVFGLDPFQIADLCQSYTRCLLPGLPNFVAPVVSEIARHGEEAIALLAESQALKSVLIDQQCMDFESEPRQPFFQGFQAKGKGLQRLIDQIQLSYSVQKEEELKYSSLLIRNAEVVDALLERAKGWTKSIEKLFNGLVKEQQKNFICFAGELVLFRKRHLVDICFGKTPLSRYFGRLEGKEEAVIHAIAEVWLRVIVLIDMLVRLSFLVKQEELDFVAILRELESPREEVVQRLHWLCFEAEMRIQIWQSQLQTFNTLMRGKGLVTQLNMGEGKTQTIMPMIVLDLVCSGRAVPRLNFMSQLMNEAYANFYRFLSATAFAIPISLLKVDREVDITGESISGAGRYRSWLGLRQVVMIDRESSLSLQLRVRQQLIRDSKLKAELKQGRYFWLFQDCNVLDVIDEADVMLSPRRSYVYSVGHSESLHCLDLRVSTAEHLLNFFYDWFAEVGETPFISFEEDYERAQKLVREGLTPLGITLVSKHLPPDFSSILASAFIAYASDSLQQFKYLRNVSAETYSRVIEFVSQPKKGQLEGLTEDELVPDNAVNHLLLLRGLLAYGVLEHCLTMKCQVDYGVPDQRHVKLVAVPYEAADIPSDKAEFSHPEVSICLSLIAYYCSGLTAQQFLQALEKLCKLNDSHKRNQFMKWMQCRRVDHPVIKGIDQVDFESDSTIRWLFQQFRNCRATVAFWLKQVVFPADLKHFADSITSSLWDIANVPYPIGFSGTKDNKVLFPDYICYQPSTSRSILGTDGRMVGLLVHNTLSVIGLGPSCEQSWRKMLEEALRLKAGAIIDAGAFLAGRSLEKEVVPLLAELLAGAGRFRGVSFCSKEGVWQVYDIVNRCSIERGRNIADHQTFVVFDEARTRGADLKMGVGVEAVVSISMGMGKDKLIQAVGRLRKFGRKQKVHLLLAKEVAEQLKLSADLGTAVKQILFWTCANVNEENQRLLLTNCRLAGIHLSAKKDYTSTEHSECRLDFLYKNSVFETTIAKQCYDLLQPYLKKVGLSDTRIVEQQLKVSAELGSDTTITVKELDNMCEREADVEIEAEQVKPPPIVKLKPRQESNKIQQCFVKLAGNKVQFSENLKLSVNFLKVYQGENRPDGKLGQANFLLAYEDRLVLITLREAEDCFNKFRILGPVGVVPKPPCLLRLCDSHRLTWLRQEVAEAKFFNGESEFSREDEEHIFRLVSDSLKRKEECEEVAAQFLRRRHTKDRKFESSSLFRILCRINYSCHK